MTPTQELLEALKAALDATTDSKARATLDAAILAFREQAERVEPVAYIRKDQLQKAAQSALLCEVTPEPRQDRIGIYTTPPAAAAGEPLTDAQKNALHFVLQLAEQAATINGYGFYRPANPHDFSPDQESSTSEEIGNHKAAREAYDNGTYTPDNSDGWLTPYLHITKAPWGIGSYSVMVDGAEEALAIVKAAHNIRSK